MNNVNQLDHLTQSSKPKPLESCGNTVDEIEKLSVEELFKLHNKIVARIRELHKAEVSKQLQKFQVGEMVCFENEGNSITGTVIRINQKTLSIKTKEGCWHVDPRNVTSSRAGQVTEAKVIDSS